MRPPRWLALLASLLAPATLAASPGGGAERAVLVIDPANPESLYVANVYMARRDVPGSHAIYLRPGASSYAAFVAENLAGFEGALDNQRIRDHADYVILPPGGSFFIPASGLISDSCAPVNRFGIASGYTLSGVAAKILGGLPHSAPNQFSAESYDARFFDADYPWFQGQPSAGGERYRVGAMLGYTGANGNTLAEVLALIERSAAADATQPGGTFYYVETTDVARSGPRDPFYPEAVSQMTAVGGVAVHLFAVLPVGEHDCLGVMTGWADPDVDGANYTLLPGSFGDHLTSFAGAFDIASQTKMSEWIEKGASGSSGAVEEPCNYAGKFPHARLHVLYRQGMALGEAWLASMGFLPFQNLLYGDPLTAPWAQPPLVDVPGAPIGPVSGTVAFAPLALASAPGAAIARLELHVDGVQRASAGAGGVLLCDTTALADGWHDVRVLAYDDTPARHVGRWRGSLTVNNDGVFAALVPTLTAGDLGTRFDFALSAGGATIQELRLLQNGRVVAAGGPGTLVLSTHGQNLGAGPVEVQAEARFTNGASARSAPVALDIAFSGGGAGPVPLAYGYRREVQLGTPCLVELPASYAASPSGATYALLTPPGQAAVTSASGAPWLVLTPNAGAAGLDSLTFRVTTSSGTSANATVVLEYVPKAVFEPPAFFHLDAVQPSPIPALSPGTGQTVELHGSGFGPQTQVTLNGAPLTGLPLPYSFVSPTLMTVDLPQVSALGPIALGVADGALADGLSVQVVPNAAPALQMGKGDASQIVFQFQGIDATLAGTPGSLHVLVASIFPQPSDLPGIVHLDLGNNFAFVPIVGTFAIDPAKGWTKVHLPLANIPPATTIYAQSVELTPSFPLPASNLQQFLVAF
jgi:hypothetical protein